MTDAASIFLASMTKSREEGDITLKCEGKCEGKDIKAHSLILHWRTSRIGIITSIYFASWCEKSFLQV